MALSGECVKFPEMIDPKFLSKVKSFFVVVRERPWVVYYHCKEFEFFRDYLRSVEATFPTKEQAQKQLRHAEYLERVFPCARLRNRARQTWKEMTPKIMETVESFLFLVRCRPWVAHYEKELGFFLQYLSDVFANFPSIEDAEALRQQKITEEKKLHKYLFEYDDLVLTKKVANE